MSILRGLILTFILLGTYAVSLSQEARTLGLALPEGRKKVKIPFEIHDNLIVIPVVLNGSLPLNFILDTGVRTAILTEKSLGDMIDMDYSRKIQFYGPGGDNLVEAYIASSISIEMPGIKGVGHAILVLDKDYLQLQNFIGTPVHGILGYEVFSRFIVEINYNKKVLILYEPSAFKKRRKYQTVPIQIQDTKPFLNATIEIDDKGPQNVKLLVDTGASHSIMLFKETAFGIQIPAKNIKSSLGRGLGGQIMGSIGRLDYFKIADFELEGAITTFPDQGSYYDSTLMTSRNGSIGGGILTRFKVAFDYFNQKMYLKKSSDFKKAFKHNMSGIVVKATGYQLSNFEVADIRPNSPADEAGVLVDDQILEINGLTAKELSLTYINGLFTSKENRRVNLKILRKGEQFYKSFRLRSDI